MLERSKLIDSLRGFAILVMILTHATAYYPSDKIASLLWNWSHFAVPIFVFCSVYLFLKKSFDKPIHFFSFVKKRAVRLLFPYYIFLGFFLLALLWVDPTMISFKYIWQSVLLIGGVDINWLVLLFLALTVILPFFAWSYKKARILFWAYFGLALLSSIGLLFYQPGFSYKYIMWLPWSLVLYFTWFYVRFEQKKGALFSLLIVSAVSCLIAFALQSAQHHSLVLIHNKYPPNLLYLSYGVTILLGLTFLEKYLFTNKYVEKIIHFFSKYSYSLYFLHYIILIVAASFIERLHLSWYLFFVIVLFITAVLQKLFNNIKER
jgi:peptidoglycan/LPS O-acetylase OafA/YrhL